MDEPDGISNAPRPLHTHVCNALQHVGEREWECRAPRCLSTIYSLHCEACEPVKRATKPHPGIYWATPVQPQQRVLPHA
jgi:hypothetical protein